MNLHEYQAKELLRAAGVPIPPGDIATTPGAAEAIAQRYGTAGMRNAQAHAGGRGKAGGVEFCKTPADPRGEGAAAPGMTPNDLTPGKGPGAGWADLGSGA